MTKKWSQEQKVQRQSKSEGGGFREVKRLHREKSQVRTSNSSSCQKEHVLLPEDVEEVKRNLISSSAMTISNC